jgi:predicted cobalt transporter CbtA
MSRASWIALVAAVLVGLLITLLIRQKTGTLVRQAEAEARAEAEAEVDLSAVSGAITPETADKEG